MSLILPNSTVSCRNLIGGAWCESSGQSHGHSIDVISPYTGGAVGTVPMSTVEETQQAIAAASKAAAAWRQVPIKERTQILLRFRALLLDNLDEISTWVAVESGKTFGEARAGVLKGVEVAEYAASLQNLDSGGALQVSRGVSCRVERVPLGVVAGVTPFNFPAMVPMWQFPIAVTLGNAYILKPSEKVPITAEFMGRYMVEAGYPPGVFSIIHGGRDVVEALVDHPDVQALGFVGSSAVARSVYSRASALGKRALALGGAKNPIIVVPDADPEVTIDGVVRSFTGCAGQRCMAASLLIAVGDVEHLIDGIIERSRQIKLGEDMGAIIDASALERLRGAVAEAVADGATLRLDGREQAQPDSAAYKDGYWLGPTILDNAKPEWGCVKRELFGPILTIVRVDTLEQAVALEANSGYGNAASVFTTKGAVARYVTEGVGAGMVGVNIGVPVPREPFSFGGTRASRYGQGDITGQGGVDLWSTLKKITTKWEMQNDLNWMS